MYYIYCYTNKINQKKYIGQTNYPKRRYSEHLYAAYHSNSKDYNLLFHRKIREYGIENFNFEIIEILDTDDEKYVDSREKYWIEYYNSYVKNNCGYNITFGGQQKGSRKKIPEEKCKKALELLKNSKYTQKEIAKRCELTESNLVDINKGKLYYQDNLDYPIRKNRIDTSIKEQIKQQLLNSNKTRQEIADTYGVSLSTVKRIKAEIKNT